MLIGCACRSDGVSRMDSVYECGYVQKSIKAGEAFRRSPLGGGSIRMPLPRNTSLVIALPSDVCADKGLCTLLWSQSLAVVYQHMCLIPRYPPLSSILASHTLSLSRCIITPLTNS